MSRRPVQFCLMIATAIALATAYAPAEDTPPATTPTTPATPTAPIAPDYAPFPGFYFDYLPDIVSSETGFELKFRIGQSDLRGLTYRYCDAGGQLIPAMPAGTPDTGSAQPSATSGTLRIPPITADDRAKGHLPIFTVPVPANIKIHWIYLTATLGGPNQQTQREVKIEVRDSTAPAADFTLAVLPAAARIGTAENIQAVAEGHDPAQAFAWATLGAHIASADDGHAIILRHTPRVAEQDRSGLVTRVFRPPASPDPNAPPRHWLVLAPAALAAPLTETRAWHTVQTLRAVAPQTFIPARANPPPESHSGLQPAAPAPAKPAAALPAADLVLLPAATEAVPFHPIAGCLAAAFAAIDTTPCDKLLIVLPWDDALYGTDPREFSLAIDALAEHFRAKQHAGAGPLPDLVLLGPFRHPSVPEKRHTMLESKLSERREAQGFQWPNTPTLSDPANWRLNAATDTLAVYGPVPNQTGLERLQDLLKGFLP